MVTHVPALIDDSDLFFIWRGSDGNSYVHDPIVREIDDQIDGKCIVRRPGFEWRQLKGGAIAFLYTDEWSDIVYKPENIFREKECKVVT